MNNNVAGQARFYTNWTKSVAYLVSDGEYIRGYFNKYSTNDNCIIDCKINDLVENIDHIRKFYAKKSLSAWRAWIEKNNPPGSFILI